MLKYMEVRRPYTYVCVHLFMCVCVFMCVRYRARVFACARARGSVDVCLYVCEHV